MSIGVANSKARVSKVWDWDWGLGWGGAGTGYGGVRSAMPVTGWVPPGEMAEKQAAWGRFPLSTRNTQSLVQPTSHNRARELILQLFFCSVDIEKTFDTVSHKKLRNAMLNIGFASRVCIMHTAQKSNVRVHSSLSSCLTHSFFHSELKTWLFGKSFPP